jgi:hypothetical protein
MLREIKIAMIGGGGKNIGGTIQKSRNSFAYDTDKRTPTTIGTVEATQIFGSATCQKPL